MKKLTFVTLAAALAFAAAPAFADPPTAPAPNPNSKSQGSLVGQASSTLIQNGPAVSDQAQVAPGNRADLVHECAAGIIC